MQWHEQSLCVGQTILVRVPEYARRFLWFYHFFFRNNDLVYLEDKAIKQTIYSILKLHA